MLAQFVKNITLCWILALVGCQQVQSRLVDDVKTMFATLSVQDSPTTQAVVTAPLPPSVPADTQSVLVATEPQIQPTTVVPKMPVAQEELTKDCTFCPEMVALPAGKFVMGSPPDEAGREADEGPVQKLGVKAFSIGKYEVTKGHWRAFVEKTGYRMSSECLTWDGDGYAKPGQLNWLQPGFAQTEDQPVVCVSWKDAQAYTQWLSQVTGQRYRLPSEVEWEYAAKAGQGLVPYPWSSSDMPCGHSNLADQSIAQLHPQWRLVTCSDGYNHTAPVGSFAANPWGIFDMQGNVMEWVSSCYTPALTSQPAENPDCPKKIIKGGGWDMPEKFIRNAYRGRAGAFNMSTGLGFRVARDQI